MKRLVELSHEIRDGMVTYKGLPAPVVCDFLSREASREHYSEGTSFQIGRVEMVANTGTYLDAPFHRFREGADIASVPLDGLAGVEGRVFRAPPDGRAVDASLFEEGVEVEGKAVLVHTGWSRHWGTDRYFEGHPFLTEDAARWLEEAGAAVVGIDSLNIDDTNDGRRPVHTTLLGAGIPILEHMTGLDALPPSGFELHAAPVRMVGMGSFPVRAYAVVKP